MGERHGLLQGGPAPARAAQGQAGDCEQGAGKNAGSAFHGLYAGGGRALPGDLQGSGGGVYLHGEGQSGGCGDERHGGAGPWRYRRGSRHARNGGQGRAV